MKFSKITLGTPLLLLAGSADAFWRMECRGRSGLARIDPLVNPGVASAHSHTIHGSSAFSSTSGTAELLTGDCTSCAVTQDKSAYWAPPLYFKDAATGKFTIVNQVGGLLAYYFLNYSPGESKITAFPSGFNMIAGDSNQRNFTLPVPDPEKSLWGFDPAQSSQSGLAQKAVGFNCLNYDIAPEGALYRHFLPDKAYLDANCKDGIRAELMFPSCWNGKDLTSKDKRSHVAYPELVTTGSCPSDFPIRLPGLFYEIIWDTHAFAGVAGEFVWSNGDPTGYGYHGDFIMGWEETFLQSAVDTCTSLSGRIQDCPLFTIQTEAESQQCHIKVPSAIASEDVSGPLAGLPGGVNVNYGPGYVVAGGASASVDPVPIPTLSHSAGSTVAPSETPLPGGVFLEGSVSKAVASPSVSVKVAAVVEPSPTPAPMAALKENQRVYTTSYSTVGNEVIEMVMIEELVTVTGPPVTMTQYVTMPARRKRHIHRHAENA